MILTTFVNPIHEGLTPHQKNHLFSLKKGRPSVTSREAAYAPIIMISPCAKLMIFIIPSTIIRPIEHNTKNAPAVNAWYTKLITRGAISIITFKLRPGEPGLSKLIICQT